MLGRNNETMREKAGRKVHGNGCTILNCPQEELLHTHVSLIQLQRNQKPKMLVGFVTASETIHNSRGALTDKGGHLHLGLMLGQLHVEK